MKRSASLLGAVAAATMLATVPASAEKITIGLASEPTAMDPHFHNLGPNNAMAALSFAAAWPLGAAERNAKWLHSGLSLSAAALAVILGIDVMTETAGTAWSGLGL